MSLLFSAVVEAETLSVVDVVRQVRAQDPGVRAAREAVAVAEAHRLEAGLIANPTLSFEREHFPEEGEDSFSLTLPVDLSTARTTRRRLAGVAVAGAGAEAARVTSGAVVEALTVFYRLLFLKRRGAIEADALERLLEAARVVRRRREEGSASGYDQSRIEIEAELAASALRQTEAGAARLHQDLASRLGMPANEASFGGSLEADETLTVEGLKSSQEESRPSLRALRVAARRAGEARRLATWSWLPGLVVSGGPRIGTDGGEREGYRLGVAVDLPIFSRGQELRSRAAALERHAIAREEVAQRGAQRELFRASQLLVTLREEVLRLSETTGDRIQRLERAAQSGYREGELSILELLDARRARTELERRQLQLALSLKEAEVALRAARGEYE